MATNDMNIALSIPIALLLLCTIVNISKAILMHRAKINMRLLRLEYNITTRVDEKYDLEIYINNVLVGWLREEWSDKSLTLFYNDEVKTTQAQRKFIEKLTYGFNGKALGKTNDEHTDIFS